MAQRDKIVIVQQNKIVIVRSGKMQVIISRIKLELLQIKTKLWQQYRKG